MHFSNTQFYKKLFSLLFFLAITLIVSSQSRNTNRSYTLMLGPEIGGSIVLSSNSENELITKFHYTFGGIVKVRPVKSFGLESGFKYNNILKTSRFYEIPLSFYLYSKSDGAFIIGPNFLYHIEEGKTDFKEPTVGFTLGAGNEFAAVRFNYFPNSPYYISAENNKFYICV